MSNATLREALAEAIHQATTMDGVRDDQIGPQHWIAKARAALAADDAARGTMRGQFEAWVSKQFPLAGASDSDDAFERHLWSAWQASRAAAPQKWVPDKHTYQGGCPDETQPDARDPECPACRELVAPQSVEPVADAEWQEEAMRLVEDYAATLHFSTREALRAHIATRPAPTKTKEQP